MFHAGDQIENPVTGERLVFHETAAETNGERVVFETIVQPGGFVAAAHVHPFQTERFEVLAGTLGMRRGKEKVELRAGETVDVEPGTPHKFWNAGDDEVRFVCTVTPALQFERLIATMYTLAAAGKTNKKGMPNPVRLAVIANHHFDDVRLPKIPHCAAEAGARARRAGRTALRLRADVRSGPGRARTRGGVTSGTLYPHHRGRRALRIVAVDEARRRHGADQRDAPGGRAGGRPPGGIAGVALSGVAVRPRRAAASRGRASARRQRAGTACGRSK